jgi:2-polyprenyl-3-methyl-5-hydroxy-6-metoxy-1,4-benzoquinol methylase
MQLEESVPQGGDVHTQEFDSFSETYQDKLNEITRITGEPGEYFAELKARYLVGELGADFPGKILDFGCGIGLLSRFLLQKFPASEIHGYDVSGNSIAQIEQGVSSCGRFTSQENELDHDYNLIVVANVMHHIAKEQRQEAISHLRDRLAPGGSLVVFEHNPANPLTRRAVRICVFDVGVVLLRPKEVCEYFRRAGLNITKKRYIAFFPRWFSWLRSFESSLGWCPIGAQYAVTGRKSS